MGPRARAIAASVLGTLFYELAWAAQVLVVARDAQPVPGVTVVFVESGWDARGRRAGPIQVTATASEAGLASLEIPKGLSGLVLLESSAWWAPPLEVGAGVAPLPLRLVAEPAGVFSGELVVPRGTPPPARLVAKVQESGVPAARGAWTQVEVPCSLTELSFRCGLPARRVDVELRAAGFASHFFWDQQLPAGGELRKGALALRAGGSVVGWVAVEDGVLEPANCAIRLATVSDPQRAGPAQERRDHFRGRQVAPTERGFFSFDGVPAGEYRLEVEHPGFASEVAYPIPVVGSGQTKLPNPILLKRPLELEVLITPVLDPDGLPWSISLDRNSVPAGVVTPFASGQADFVGRFVASAVTPGDYLVKVGTSKGAVFFGERVTVAPGATTLEVALEIALVHGRVLVGDEPARATLDIGGRRRLPSVRVESDEDGRFEAVLPRWGEWRVDIEVPSSGIETEQRVEIPKPLKGNLAEIEISIVDTKLAGVVQDMEGTPVPGAQVRIDSAKSIRRTTDEEGRFEARGLPAGRAQLKASTREARSRAQVVDIVESEEATDVTLVLEPVDLFGGLVLSEAGPVPGVSVSASVRGLPGLDNAESAITDAQGHFEVQLTRGGSAVDLHVMAPGFTLFAGAFDPRERGPAIVNLERESGEVEVSGGWNTNLLRAAGVRPYLFFRGTALPVALLARWTELNGRNAYGSQERLELPRMPVGSYRLCAIPVQQLLLHGPFLGSTGASCHAGELASGARIALKLPTRSEGE